MELVIAYLLVNIAVGAVACFFGKRLFYIMLAAIVFLGVLNVGLAATDGSALSLFIAVVLGIAAAFLSKYAYKAGVFLTGFAAGASLGFIVALLVQEASAYLGIVVIVAGLIAGLAAVRWCDFFVRLGTAYAGSTFVASNALAGALAFDRLVRLADTADPLGTFQALSAYIGGSFSAAHGSALLAGTLVLTIVGAVVQRRTGEK